MADLPYMRVFPGDELKGAVSGCSLEAQGLWMRMRYVMHASERYGHLCQNGVGMTSEVIAARCGTTLDKYTTLLSELDAFNVPCRTTNGIIYSRELLAEQQKRRRARKNGAQGGNPALVNQQVNLPDNHTVNLPLNMNMNSGGGEGVEGAGGDDELDRQVRAYFREHCALMWDAMKHAKCRKLVLAVGWERARKLVNESVGKNDPVAYALGIVSGEQSREATQPKASPPGQWSKQKNRYCPG